MADSHTGDAAGLTPYNMGHRKHYWWQETLRDWWRGKLKEIGPVDECIHVGETIEGEGKKDTLELVLTDMEEQAEVAGDLLHEIQTDSYLLTYASRYHSIGSQRYEHQVVKRLKELGNKADIAKHQRVEAYGVRVDAAHKIGASSTPYGPGTQLGKVAAIDMLRSLYNDADPAHIYLRGHIHSYFRFENDMFTACVLPCLKWPTGSYGVEIDRPFYTMGLMALTIWENGRWDLDRHILKTKMPDMKYRKRGKNGGQKQKR